MQSRFVCLVRPAVIILSLFFAITCARADSPERRLPSIEQLPEVCRAAKAQFRPLTAADLQQASAELRAAAGRLDKRLKAAGENGENWGGYLKWDRLQEQLLRNQPDPAVLSSIYRRYAAGHEGLELIWFVEVRQAIRHYVELQTAMASPNLEDAYGKLMDDLADHLKTYAEKPSAEEALVIGPAISWLENTRQAPTLVQAVRHHFVHPNLLLTVSAGVVADGLGGPVDDVSPIRDVILGTRIRGTGHTKGRTTVELIADADRAVFDTTFLGITKSKNIGRNGPVRIYSDSVIRVGSRKRFWVDSGGFASLPAVSNAAVNTQIKSIRANRGSRLVEKIAWKRACKQEKQAEQIAARHAENRANNRIDREAAKMLGRANEAFEDKLRGPLLRRKLFPQLLRFTTTDDGLKVVTLRADASQLAAPGPPPELVERADLGLRVHQSMANNMAASALAGMTVRDETFEAAIVTLLGELPPRLKDDTQQEPWAITFARQRPISVAFVEDTVQLTIRGRRYYKDKEAYPGMNVTVVYKLVPSDHGFEAIRQGEVEIFPPGFVPGGDKKLSTRQVVIRKLLERRLSKVFEEKLEGDGFEMPGKWKKLGKMIPMQLVARDGWLTAAWQRASAEKPSEVAFAMEGKRRKGKKGDDRQ